MFTTEVFRDIQWRFLSCASPKTLSASPNFEVSQPYQKIDHLAHLASELIFSRNRPTFLAVRHKKFKTRCGTKTFYRHILFQTICTPLTESSTVIHLERIFEIGSRPVCHRSVGHREVGQHLQQLVIAATLSNNFCLK